MRDDFPNTVEDWTVQPTQVLCYATSAILANGAYEAYAPQHPERVIMARWGGWTMRSNRRDRTSDT
jgi:hypothetical protein